ncbi:hypothetical protein [uncultured Deefgea sp.]|uniref:hypothetical protein n=1 Tax=uncultured Deefgea sp. TaxID=1304914 RepID=UPI00262739CA|nr:hypothetical protein [uncultured Deefgea sp.]
MLATQWPTPKAETLPLRLVHGVDLSLLTTTCATWLANLLRALAWCRPAISRCFPLLTGTACSA